MRSRRGHALPAIPAGLAAACAFALALTAGAGAEVGSAPDTATWVTDGPVYAIARSGDRTFIGGDFSLVGPRTGPGVQVTSTGTGSLSPAVGSFPEVSGGAVFAALSDRSGGWYIGGDFTHVGGTALPRLAHLVPSGGALAVDPGFAPRPDGPIRALALGEVTGKDADVLYIGGDFGSLGGDVLYRNFAAVDRGTGKPVAEMAAPNDAVHAIDVLRVQDMSIVFVAGPFTTPKNNVAAIWGVGTNQEGTATDYTHTDAALAGVKALTVGPVQTNAVGQAGAAVYLAGEFGLETTGFLIDRNTGMVAKMDFNVDARPNAACAGCLKSIDALATSSEGGILYLGGSFTRINGADRTNLMAITGVSDVHGVDPGFVPKVWNPAPNGGVESLLTSGGTLYAGGAFTSFPQGTRVGLAALSPSVDTAGTGDLLGWDPRASGGAVKAIAVAGDVAYAGGTFTSVGGSPHENVAALDSAGRLIDSWTASTDGRVNALAASGDRVYLGGRFDHANGQPRMRLAAVDALGTGALNGQFSPAAEPACTGTGCVRSEVFSLSLRDSTLYVGGAFARLAGASRTNAGAVDAGTGTPLDWAPNPDGNVYSLLATCGTVYAGGGFAQAGGKDRRRLAELDPQTGAATAWNPSVAAGSAVRAIARDEDVVYVGGNFAKVGGTARDDLAALDAASGNATAWNPSVPQAGEEVWAVAAAPAGDVVFAGGRFTRAGRADRSNVAAFGRGAGDATSWDPGADAPVRALTADGVSLAVGGDFHRAGPLTQQGFASFGFGSGTSTEAVRCAPPAPPPEPPRTSPLAPRVPRSERATDRTPPRLMHVRLSHRRFRTARRTAGRAQIAAQRGTHVGTKFKYGLSERAVVRYTFKRKTRVRCQSAKWRRACERWPRGNTGIHCRSHRWQRRCYRWRRVGSMRHFSRGGKVRRRFDGRVGRRWLRPGKYRVRLRAADLAGNRSNAVRRRFRVVRR